VCSVLISSYTSIFSTGETSWRDAHIIDIHNPVAHLRSDTSDHPSGSNEAYNYCLRWLWQCQRQAASAQETLIWLMICYLTGTNSVCSQAKAKIEKLYELRFCSLSISSGSDVLMIFELAIRRVWQHGPPKQLVPKTPERSKSVANMLSYSNWSPAHTEQPGDTYDTEGHKIPEKARCNSCCQIDRKCRAREVKSE